MIKKVKYIIALLLIGGLFASNINFISEEKAFSFLSLVDINALAANESGSIGYRYQMILGCEGIGFAQWKRHCCKGNSTTCVNECPRPIGHNCSSNQ